MKQISNLSILITHSFIICGMQEYISPTYLRYLSTLLVNMKVIPFQHNVALLYADWWGKKLRFSMKAHQSTNVTKAKIPDLECGVGCQRIDTLQVERSVDFNESTLHKADPRHLTKICMQFMRTFQSDVLRIFLWKSLNIFIRITGLGNQKRGKKYRHCYAVYHVGYFLYLRIIGIRWKGQRQFFYAIKKKQ